MLYLKLFEDFNLNRNLAYIQKEFGRYIVYTYLDYMGKAFMDEDFFTDLEAVKYCERKKYEIVTKEEFDKFYQDRKKSLKLAPNGRKSNLNSIQWDLVRTPEFKAWFGDWETSPESASKVLDVNGEPLVVWHGTTADFHIFDPTFKGKRGGLRERYFAFTTNKKMAEYYSSGRIGKDIGFTKPFFLNIRKMPEYDNKKRYYRQLEVWNGYDWKNVFFIQQAHETGFTHGDDRDKSAKNIITFEKTDGFVVRNTCEKEIWEEKLRSEDYELIGDTFYVYNSNQIKLADGTNTKFSSSNDVRENKNI